MKGGLTETARPPKAGRRADRTMTIAMALGFAIGFVNMGQRTGFGVLYPAMSADQGWSASQVTGAFSVAMIVYSLVVVGSGALIDRFGVRTMILLGTAVFTLGLVLVGQARELWQVYLCYGALISFGNASLGFVPMLKLLSLRAAPRLGLGLGLFNVGQGIGALVVSPVLQLIVDHAGGWRAGFTTLGVMAVLVLAPLALVGAPGRGERGGVRSLHGDAPPAGIWRQRVFWIMLAVNASLGYLLLLPAHQVAHLTLVGLDPLFAASAGGLFGACIGVSALFGGWAIDRWGGGRLDVIAATVMSVGLVALLLTGPAAAWLAGVYVLGGGLGRGGLGVTCGVLQARAFAGPHLGKVCGTLDVGFGFGAFAGPFLVALGRDLTGSYIPGLATALLAGWIVALGTSLARRTIERRTAQAGA